MLKSTWICSAVCLPVLFIVAGCGEAKPDGMPTLYSATVTVTQGGSPLAGASVQLEPVDPSTNRWVSGGSTDDNGRVVIRTQGKFNGAPEGKYKITVNKVIGDSAPASDDPGAVNTNTNYHSVAKEYRSASTTPAEIAVTPTGDNTVTIDVGEAVVEPVANL